MGNASRFVCLGGLVATIAFAMDAGCGGGDSQPGGSTTGGAGATSSTGAQSSTSSTNCSVTGCAPTPMCPLPCDNPCGCCSCQPGSTEVVNGMIYECEGNCWALSEAGTCDIPECFAPIACVEMCGGPVVYSSCCPCPSGLIQTTQCTDAG